MLPDSASHDLYAIRPDLYELMHAEHVDDARFLYEFVQTLGEAPEVVELGCGTGRLLLPMLDAGAHVVGIDREPAMLALARERVAPYGDRARLVEGDMQRFALGQQADLVVIGLNTFMHLLTTAEQLDCLRAAHRQLRAAGVLFIDLPNPHLLVRDIPAGVLQHRFTRSTRSAPRALVTLCSTTTFSTADQLMHSIFFFDEIGEAGAPLRRTVAAVTLRLTYRFELELLLARAGFAVRHLYGDYDAAPFEDDSERLICVAPALA